jgi:Spy/CpxP family protein refolding chaperone
MNGLLAVGAVLALSAPAWAQNNQQQEDPVERQVQRYREQLNLTDEQVPKVRELLKKSSEDLRSVLTDEQKQRLDQGGGRGNRGQGGNNAQPGQGNFGRFGGLPGTDELKTQLSLSDDQVAKINAIRDGVREETRNLFRNRQPGGNPLDQFARLRDQTNQKIREVLTDEQKPKFDEIVKNAQAQTPTLGGPGGRGGSVDERVARIMETLRVEDAKEAEAIKGVVKKVVELMDKLEAAQRDSRTKLEEASRNRDLSDDAVGEKITETRGPVKELEKELAAARKDLADIVTNRQELELLRRGILR